MSDLLNDPVIIAAAIALLVSINYGFANHIQHIALDYMDVRSGTLVNIATTVFLFLLLSPFFLQPATLLTPSAGYFALAGLIVPALSITFATLSVKIIGPGLTSGLAATSPVFAMAIAVAFLDEIVTSRILLGTAIVTGSIMMIAFRTKSAGAAWPLWALALPLAAAAARGISHPLIKLGLAGVPSPMTATLVSASVSLIVLAILQVLSGRALPQFTGRALRGYYWFALCGIINGLGLLGLAAALELGDVVVVSPIVASTPAFTLLLGYFIFRREIVRWTSVAAIVLIFSGIVLIILR